jgi:hypothetical protein
MDARRQRIVVSQSCRHCQAGWNYNSGTSVVAIAMVHSANRLASAIALSLFATGIALSAAYRCLQSAIHRRDFRQTGPLKTSDLRHADGQHTWYAGGTTASATEVWMSSPAARSSLSCPQGDTSSLEPNRRFEFLLHATLSRRREAKWIGTGLRGAGTSSRVAS